ncbi:MAG: hypothetical protein ACK58L_00135 [Planctomycetota bacterium]
MADPLTWWVSFVIGSDRAKRAPATAKVYVTDDRESIFQQIQGGQQIADAVSD